VYITLSPVVRRVAGIEVGQAVTVTAEAGKIVIVKEEWMFPKAGHLCQDRYSKAMEAKAFFLALFNAPVEHIAIENPTPLKVVELPKHSQVIQPYEYGHEYSKRTLLWLKNLPLLKPTDIKSNYKPYLPSNTGGKKRGQKYHFVNITQKERSKTFLGVAKARDCVWCSKKAKFPKGL
jgi:hypothetical protein